MCEVKDWIEILLPARGIELLEEICHNMVGNTFCPMGEAAVNPVLSTLKHFRHEYEHYITHKQPVTAA